VSGQRRSYGTGELYTRADRTGAETWYGRWMADGVRMQRRIGPKRPDGTRDGLTRLQAEAELRRLRAEITPARRVAGDALTITDLGLAYVERMRHDGRKHSSIIGVQSILKTWLVPYFADRDLRRVTAEDVRALVKMMQKGQRSGPRRKGDRRYGRRLAVSTVRNNIGTLSAMLSLAERKGWLNANVAKRVDLPRGTPLVNEIRFLEAVEVEAVAAAAIEGDYQQIDSALFTTAAMTGLRVGELVALRWRDVDWTASRIRVRQSFVLGEFGTPKSRRSTRSVPMVDQVGGELQRLHVAAGEPTDDVLVFADPFTGEPLSKAAILKRFRLALTAAKLDNTHRFHDLRHTFGTQMAAVGVPLRTLQEWMGHRDAATTARYADYAPSLPHELAMVETAFRRGTESVIGNTS
jgi:integrase